MKAWIWLGMAALLAAALPAAAQPGDDRPGMDRRERFAERQAMRQQRAERQAGEAQREGFAAGRCEEKPCRMSPEERRKLRRDIHDAGRDIYRRGPRHPD